MIIKLILEEECHGSGVKGENRYHIGSIKFQATLVEDGWVWLIIDNVNNGTQGLAYVQGGEEKQLTETNLMQFDLVQVPELR